MYAGYNLKRYFEARRRREGDWRERPYIRRILSTTEVRLASVIIRHRTERHYADCRLTVLNGCIIGPAADRVSLSLIYVRPSRSLRSPLLLLTISVQAFARPSIIFCSSPSLSLFIFDFSLLEFSDTKEYEIYIFRARGRFRFSSWITSQLMCPPLIYLKR